MVITDFKYFNRIKWQYLVLDEAQAIKSSSSQRWKMLLEFRCRNRLLLSGTPIQNSMAELWSLLHFVMPTLFDSHDEFNDWFSKDIESSAETKSQVDESKSDNHDFNFFEEMSSSENCVLKNDLRNLTLYLYKNVYVWDIIVFIPNIFFLQNKSAGCT